MPISMRRLAATTPRDRPVRQNFPQHQSDFEQSLKRIKGSRGCFELVAIHEEVLALALIAANSAEGKQRNNRSLSPASSLGATAMQKRIVLRDLSNRLCTTHSHQ
jgi:hypothetical protein